MAGKGGGGGGGGGGGAEQTSIPVGEGSLCSIPDLY